MPDKPNYYNMDPAEAMRAQGYGQIPQPWNPYDQFDPFISANQNYRMVDRINNVFNQNPYQRNIKPYMRPGGRIMPDQPRNVSMNPYDNFEQRYLQPSRQISVNNTGMEIPMTGIGINYSDPNSPLPDRLNPNYNPYQYYGPMGYSPMSSRTAGLNYLRQATPVRQPSNEYLNYQNFIDKLLFPDKYKAPEEPVVARFQRNFPRGEGG